MRQNIGRHAGALLLLAALVILILTPNYRPWQWATHIHDADAHAAAYGTNWAQHTLWSRPWDYFNMPIFHPQENPRFFTDLNPLAAFLTAPLRLTGEPVLAYNAMMVLIIIGVAWMFYLVGWKLTHHRRAAIAAALMYACNGDQIYHSYGHPNIVCPIFFPPAIYLLWRLNEQSRLRHAIPLTLCLSLQFPASIYHGVMLLMFCGCTWLTFLVLRRGKVNAADGMVLCAFLFALAVALVYTTPFRILGDRFGQTRGLHEAGIYSADVLGYAIPSYANWAPQSLLGAVLAGVVAIPQRLENTQFFGYFPWFCAIAALVAAAHAALGRSADGRQKFLLGLLPAALAGVIFSFGPWLWIGSYHTAIPLPFKYFWEWVQPVQFMRVPSRFSVIPGTLIALAFCEFLSRWNWFNSEKTGRRFFSMTAVTLILLIEFFPVKGVQATAVNPRPMQLLEKYTQFRTIASIPLNQGGFLVASSKTFPNSPSGTMNGVYNYHYQQIVERCEKFPDPSAFALLDAMGVDALLIYGRERIAQAEAAPELLALEKWDDLGIFQLRRHDEKTLAPVRQELANLLEKPQFSDTIDFPASAPSSTRWRPQSWRRLDEEAQPPTWIPMRWEDLGNGGYQYCGFIQRFFDGLPSRPVTKVHVRMAIEDKGVDFAFARLFWINAEDTAWLPQKSVETPIKPDGKFRIVTFDLTQNPNWLLEKHVTGLQFEFTTTPYPGQKVLVDEIRLEPDLFTKDPVPAD
ncbi:hypothetical protein IT570_09320 [Candidatus Sumerlaeota bacterium]|nr:hypothetical protein [Candidatus Sumerlaeota bacterium]